jgi:methylated-DNA-protein-cysteine methyltransferase related protein
VGRVFTRSATAVGDPSQCPWQRGAQIPEPKTREIRRHFSDDVRDVVETLAVGTVLTYGDLAREAGYAGAARAVGNYLSRCSTGLPWWRVVTSTGRLVPGHEREQARLLRLEGILVANGRVVILGRSPRNPKRSVGGP